MMLVGAVQNPATAKGVVRRVLEGALSEGVLEELPQSIQEQVLQNAALGKSLDEGVDQAAVLGLLSGAAMGGGANVLGGRHRGPAANEPLLTPPPVPPVLGLPAPTITVDQAGVAQTTDQRQALRESVAARVGTILERGPLTKAANAANADVLDVQPKPAGALARAAATVNPEGISNESAIDQTPADEVSQQLPGAGGAQLSNADAPAVEPAVAGSVAPGVLGEGAAVGLEQADAPAVEQLAAAEPVAPAVFPTYEAANNFRREQKARGATIDALPAPVDGGFVLARKGTAEYTAGEALRDERRTAKERAAAGILDGDILNKQGKPFTIKLPAVNAAKKAGDGHEVVAVKGGFVVRPTVQESLTVATAPAAAAEPEAVPQASIVEHTTGRGKVLRGVVRTDLSKEEASAIDPYTFKKDGGWFIREKHASAEPVGSVESSAPAAAGDLTGKKIDGEWTAFAPDSGTRGVPRADMPQIKAEHRGAMVNFLNARGIAHEQVEIPATDLKPTQAEFSPARVDKAKAFEGGDRSILVSADGHVLDGHHQWLAKRDAGEPVKAIRLDAPISKLIEEVKQFPSAETSDGAAAPAVPASRPTGIQPDDGPVPKNPKGEHVAERTPGLSVRQAVKGTYIVYDKTGKELASFRMSQSFWPAHITYADGVQATYGIENEMQAFAAPIRQAELSKGSAPEPVKSPKTPKGNTIFTEGAAAAARARMKAKLSTPMSGIDPELLQDGITLAGYHIEKGARTFAAYARAMLDDMGEGIRPYLKQLYMAVKFDPRATALDGMDGAASVEAVNLDSIEAAPASADTGGKENGQDATRNLDRTGTGALERAPAEDVRPPGEGGDAGARADGSGGSDERSDAGADRAGRDASGSVGADTRDLPVPARGTRATAKDEGNRRVPRAPRPDARAERLRPESSGLNLEGGPNPAPNAPAIAAPQVEAKDFTIDDDLGLGEGGQKTKFKNNVAAIRLVAELDATGRLATPAEQRVLAQYVGWGGLPQAFDPANADWSREHAELKALLSEQDLADARRSTRYAHYTSRPIIVDGIYAALRRFGFTGGKTLEAGAGVGNFIGLMPADMRSAGRFTAIEREPISSAIARQLYPRQNVQRGDFTEFKGTDAYFDAAVGNPPFASDTQTDRSGRKHLSGLSLHNYFFGKAVDMLREGGVLAQVVTNSFLDARADAARRYISDRTVFLGAIRLPNNAFAKNAGTDVTTDIVFLQKRPDSEIGGKAARADAKRWMATGTYTDSRGKQVALNQYFIDNPSMMLGEYGAFGSMYGPDFPALVAREGQDTLALLREAVQKLPEGIYKSIADTGSASQAQAAVVALKNPTVSEGGYFHEGEKLMQRLPDLGGEARAVEITPATQWTEKTTLGESGFARIKALASMRTTVRGLIAAEMADDKAMGRLRTTLNAQYDAYRKDHGLINDPSTLRVFDDDPDFPLLASLEHGYTPGIGPVAAKRQGVKPTKSTAKKAPIFERRVVAARTAVRKVDTPADALAVSMAERGRLDAAYIGKLLGREPDDVLQELSTGDKPMLFRDPATDEYVLRDAYLSGNVRAKLAQAKAAGAFTNTKALEEVQPADVGAHEISARVGSPWVPEAVYEAFAAELFGEGTTAKVRYLKLNSSYQIDVRPGNTVAWNNTWGTPHTSGGDILSALLNNRAIKVTYRDSEGKTHTNVEATEAANVKATELRDKFSDWLFKDSDRADTLVRAYNDTNNNYVTRVYDGSMMTFPGKVPDDVIKFRRHQRDAIARTVQDRTALYDHVVGAGKTFTVVSSAMELKRTGLAHKNMVAVPNHLVKQWAADFYRLYPGANVLTATKKDFEKANRRKFLAKIATGDWDAVVIAHSSFSFIKPAPEFEAAFNQREVAKIVSTINLVREGDGDGPLKKRTVKQLEALKERLENRVKALRDKPMDDLLDFEQLGVDQLFVDEFHMYKNLMFSTKMQNVQGLGDPAGSQRAYDMYVKINQIFAKNGRDQGVVAATGTPVSNSLAEMYHMMRYLMPGKMQELGFESFDAWANTFASVEQVWMQKPSGDGFKASSRMSNFVNTPELLKMFDQVCDTVTMDDIKAAYREENAGAEFPLPKLKNDRRTPVSLNKTPAQEAYMKELAARAKKVEERRGPPKKGEDNVLVIMGDGRKAAMDIRLVDPTVTEREPGGRIDAASDRILERYQRFAPWKGTQLVFSDLGTPIKHAKTELKEYEALQQRVALGNEDVQASAALGNESALAIMEDAEAAQAELDSKGGDWLGAVQAALRGFSVYDDLKAALVEKGIPENEIAFIHDYNTDDQKAALFRKVNAGDIRVVVGSTAKMGAGTNVQERVVAEHHLDVPWRPSDVEQREGRVLRQGNVLMNEIPDFEVEILAYVTKDTLDMRMWQTQETKLKMINQLRMRKVGREVDNAFEDLELSAGEMQAAATGNIDLLHEIQLRTEVKKLEQRGRAFYASKNELESRRRRNAERLVELPKKMEKGRALAQQVEAYQADALAQLEDFKATIDGTEYTDWREAQRYLRDKTDATVETADKDGNVAKRAAPIDVTIDGEQYTARAALAEAFSDIRGDMDPIVWRVGSNEYRRRTRIGSAIRQGVIDAIADQQEKPLGAIAGFDVAVEGSLDKGGLVLLDVTLSQGGKVVASNDVSIADTGRAPDQVIRMVDNMLNSMASEQQYLGAQLERAQKEQADLEATESQGDWADEPKLEDARAKHKAVLARLNGKGSPTAAPAVPDAPAFSRGSGAGMTVDAAQRVVDAITAKWKNAPRVVVVPDLQHANVPNEVRDANTAQRSQGAGGEPEGFFFQGDVFIVAGQLATEEDVARVLFHESLGHFGLRGAFGADLLPILQQLASLRRAEVAAKAREYGLDMNDPQHRLIAAEEVLAELAQTTPELGFVQRAIAAIRSWLRRNLAAYKGLELSDAEIVRDFILPARGWVQRGKSPAKAPSLAAAFSLGESEDSAALRELSKADDLFALPRSAAKTVAGVAADINDKFKVREMKPFGGRTDYQITTPDGSSARLMVRDPNPYGKQLYGYDVVDGELNGQLTERPGENPEDVPPTGDVWIDVSLMKEGVYGAEVYAMAAAFAHNTGRIFIGDPAGLSDVALRRRLEQMISSALKYGTTAHLAPHPDQVKGGQGVPALKWVYGDHAGNIERMIAASVAAMDNAFPAASVVAFNPQDGTFFRTDNGRPLSRGQLAVGLGESLKRARKSPGSMAGRAQAGWRTVARSAVFKSLLREAGGGVGSSDGRSAGLLGGLLAQSPQLGDAEPSDRIFYSRSKAAQPDGLNDPRDFRAKATQAVSDLFDAPGAVGWWHKTVGTMHNLAKRSPQFGRVFDAVQTFLSDVSAYATEAADLAPSLLPKLETWRDIGKSPISADDTKAIAAPIFEGTLTWARDADGKLVKMADLEARYAALSSEDKAQMLLRKRLVSPEQLQRWQASALDVYTGAVRNRFEAAFLQPGTVFTDAELKATFGSTPEQIRLYREFRAAVDQSLNRVTISEMLRFGGKDVAAMRDIAMDSGSADVAGVLLRDHLLAMAEETPARAEVLIDTANKMIEKADRAKSLIDRGYAPLSRFGNYTVDVLDEAGERAYFGMFESRAEANRMARRMRENYPTGTITQGTVSQQAYKLFSGITPETLELFGEMVGLESQGEDAQHQMFQQYLKLAKANRSAMKRLIERKGIAGYNEDAGRVLAGFIYSNARLTSTNLHTGEINQAAADIPKTDGELKDMAVKLADYVRNPQEEAQALRGMLFTQYLGGSLASAMVNMTQPVAVTMPYLSQWGGALKAAGRMRSALADVLKKSTGDARLDAALKKAEEEGIVAPQEVHQLMAQAQGRGALRAGDGTVAGNLSAKAQNVVSKIALAWGKPFAAAEQFNRRVTFIAAFRTAVAEGIENPARFAEEAIRDTQFVYNKGNKPQWARGAIGGTLFTFKQYSISYMELLHRMATTGGAEGKKAALFSLAMLFLMGGAGGLPFMGDAEDVLDGIMQRLGYSFSSKQARRQFFIDVLGADAAKFVERGVSGLPGVPIDVAGRLGMGNLIPGTGLLTKKQDYGRDVAEILGPAGDLAQRAFQGAGQALSGKPLEGLTTAAPTAVRNVAKAFDMYQTGMYRDQKGRKVIDSDGYDALVKAIGFQPSAVAQVQEANAAQQDLIGQNKLMKTELADSMAAAVFERDPERQQDVRGRMLAWNKANPHSPVTIDMAGVRRRVIAMRQSKAERIEKSAPKAIRSDVRAALQEGAV
ncbi:PLxRFG domain-containing protein [Variovorax sp. PAMC26660]|uniref:PLxRFG domain-containing protein n=1 Tax=Variovorax sp. PAMC26660 TaxID=2762322 RepID=UPI00164E8973|nr:PLxRFG domain-containing protein [Variovorax sp. PAMC26660]QNK66100.1 PLxRFG domain-containing protein [Variovorax sp. PAMC26660]